MSEKEKKLDALMTPGLPFAKRLLMLTALINDPDITPEQMVDKAIYTPSYGDRFNGVQGIYGNVWVRGHYYEKAGDYMETHTHQHHHQSLVGHGSVMAYIEGCEPQIYHAGEFISVHKGLEHSFVAMEDDTTQFCVWALRDENGDVPELLDGIKLPYDPDRDLHKIAKGHMERIHVIHKIKV